MIGREIVINDTGTFVRLTPAYPGFPDKLAPQLIKISAARLSLNSHGGYVSPEIAAQCKKQSIQIHPSAIIGAVKISARARNITIGADCVLGDGTAISVQRSEFFITLEPRVIIGQNNILKNNLKIKSGTVINAGNKIIGNLVDDFQDPDYNLYSIGTDTYIGSYNCFVENFAIERDCQIGNHNEIKTELELSTGLIMGDYNWLGAYSKVGDYATLGSHCLVSEDARIDCDCILADNVQIHKKTVLHMGVRVATGAAIGQKSEIETMADIGREVRVSAHSFIGADVEIGAGATIGTGSNLAAAVKIFPGVSVPPKSRVFPGKIQDVINRKSTASRQHS